MAESIYAEGSWEWFDDTSHRRSPALSSRWIFGRLAVSVDTTPRNRPTRRTLHTHYFVMPI